MLIINYVKYVFASARYDELYASPYKSGNSPFKCIEAWLNLAINHIKLNQSIIKTYSIKIIINEQHKCSIQYLVYKK